MVVAKSHDRLVGFNVVFTISGRLGPFGTQAATRTVATAAGTIPVRREECLQGEVQVDDTGDVDETG